MWRWLKAWIEYCQSKKLYIGTSCCREAIFGALEFGIDFEIPSTLLKLLKGVFPSIRVICSVKLPNSLSSCGMQG